MNLTLIIFSLIAIGVTSISAIKFNKDAKETSKKIAEVDALIEQNQKALDALHVKINALIQLEAKK